MEPLRQNPRRTGSPSSRCWSACSRSQRCRRRFAYTHYANIELLKAGLAIPAGILLGVVALSLGRRARARSERTIGRIGGARAARTGRILGRARDHVSLTARVAVGVYELLNRLSG